MPSKHLARSKVLTNAGIRLRDGLQLPVFDWSDDEEDLEAEATVRYDVQRAVWLAEFGPNGYAYIPKATARPRDASYAWHAAQIWPARREQCEVGSRRLSSVRTAELPRVRRSVRRLPNVRCS